MVVTHLFASPILLTKFGLSVSPIWSPGLIENLTFWPCDFQNTSQLAIYILDFSQGAWNRKKIWSGTVILWYIVHQWILHLKIHFYFMLNKITFLLGNPCVPEYKLLTVQTSSTLAKLPTSNKENSWLAQLKSSINISR